MEQKDYTIPPTYTLYGYTVTFSPETWAYRRLAKRARGLVNSETKAYVKAFTENLSEQYFEDRRERLRDSVEKIAEPIVDLLHEYHKDDYSVRSYVDQCMSTLGDDLEDLNDRIQERYEDIADDADKLSAYNENLKQQKYMYNSVVHDSILERMTANAGVISSTTTLIRVQRFTAGQRLNLWKAHSKRSKEQWNKKTTQFHQHIRYMATR